jgi:hypothetical protein
MMNAIWTIFMSRIALTVSMKESQVILIRVYRSVAGR